MYHLMAILLNSKTILQLEYLTQSACSHEMNEGFEVLKVTEANFLRSIEKGISFG